MDRAPVSTLRPRTPSRRLDRQIELLNRRSGKTVLELSAAMAEWICDFYNPLRRHSAPGYLTPNEYEAFYSKETQAAFS